LWAALFPEVAGVFITSAFVMLIPSSASLGAIGVAAVLAGIAWLLTVAIGAWQASAISKGWIGDSSLIIPGNGPEAVARAIQGAAALNSARAQTRWSLRLFGFEVRRWRLAAFARATYTVAPSGTWGRITVRTRGLRNVELHQRVKGSILESLERERGAPLQASER